MTENGTPPPQDLDAEEYVLGSLLLGRDRVADAVLETGLRPDHFYRESHGKIFATAVGLHGSGKAADAITLADELDRSGILTEVGGKVRVHELAALVPASANAPHYARIVVEMATLRGLIRLGVEIQQLGWDRPAEAQALVDRASSSMVAFQAQLAGMRQEAMTGYHAATWLEEEMGKGPADDREGIAVPFRFMDRLRGGRLYILGGPPKEGKTALSTQHVRAALEDGASVGFWTLEMSRYDLTRRIASTFGVPIKQLERRNVEERHQGAYRNAVSAMASWADRLHLWDGTATASSIRRRHLAVRYDLVVVDHLHFFDWKERRDLEREVRALAVLAVEEEVPVLLLSQLKRTGKRPTMGDFRESGMIEADAAMACAVWRKREKGLPTSEAEWLVLADRFGPVRKHDLYFDGPCVRFTPLEREPA